MKEILIAIRLFLAFTVITGLAYPLIVTGIGQTLFRSKANGSMIVRNGVTIGSRLIGQQFEDPKYLWGRPSATSPEPYNASASSGSNQGPTNPDLLAAIQHRVKVLKDSDPNSNKPVPTDLATASASGLDPHISLAAAEYQLDRIAKARGIEWSKLQVILHNAIEDPMFGVLGEPVVNVLEFNLALDEALKVH